MTLHASLKTYFGFNSFRPYQEEIVTTVLAGQDCLAILPTGSGKSLCYQLPAILAVSILALSSLFSELSSLCAILAASILP